jgi:hypothetical protein
MYVRLGRGRVGVIVHSDEAESYACDIIVTGRIYQSRQGRIKYIYPSQVWILGMVASLIN